MCMHGAYTEYTHFQFLLRLPYPPGYSYFTILLTEAQENACPSK